MSVEDGWEDESRAQSKGKPTTARADYRRHTGVTVQSTEGALAAMTDMPLTDFSR